MKPTQMKATFLIMLIPAIVLISACVGGGGVSQCEVFTGQFSECSGSISGKTVTLNVPEISKYKGSTFISEVSAKECSRAGEGLMMCDVPVSCTPEKNTNPFSATCQFQQGKVYAVKFKLGLRGTGLESDVPQDLACSQTNAEEDKVRWDCEISYFQVSGQA